MRHHKLKFQNILEKNLVMKIPFDVTSQLGIYSRISVCCLNLRFNSVPVALLSLLLCLILSSTYPFLSLNFYSHSITDNTSFNGQLSRVLCRCHACNSNRTAAAAAERGAAADLCTNYHPCSRICGIYKNVMTTSKYLINWMS